MVAVPSTKQYYSHTRALAIYTVGAAISKTLPHLLKLGCWLQCLRTLEVTDKLHTFFPFLIFFPFFLNAFSLPVSVLPKLYDMAGEATAVWGFSTSKKLPWFWIEMSYALLCLSLHKLWDFGSAFKKQAIATFPTSHRTIELLRLERLIGSPSPVINPCLWLL